jgi:hypothetical protein
MRKILLLFVCFNFANMLCFSQDADYRNWKNIEFQMFQFASSCIAYANSPEWDSATRVHMETSDSKIICEYDVASKSGMVQYAEYALSYSV